MKKRQRINEERAKAQESDMDDTPNKNLRVTPFQLEQRAQRKQAKEYRKKKGVKQMVRYVRHNADNANSILSSDDFEFATKSGMKMHADLKAKVSALRAK